MISIGGYELDVRKARFRTFLAIQQYRSDIQGASEPEEQGRLICECIALVLSIPIDIVSSAPWKEVALAYVAIVTENIPTRELAFLKVTGKDEKLPWDYSGREWFALAHMFAKHYGWTLDYTANLEVDDALKLVQEMLVADQLQREWEWDLSEKSTAYDPSTKKSKHIELPRPSWMVVVPEPPKKVKIHRGLIPKGLVIKLDGSDATY